MRLINSSIRGVQPEDMLRFHQSAKVRSAVKQLARKQLRARERQALIREDMAQAHDYLAEREKDMALVRVRLEVSDHNILCGESTRGKRHNRRRRASASPKPMPIQGSPFASSELANRTVLVRFVGSNADHADTYQVLASSAA